MSLSKTEKNLNVVLKALGHEKSVERAKAISRLNHIDLWPGRDDIETIANALAVAHEKEATKVGNKQIVEDIYTEMTYRQENRIAKGKSPNRKLNEYLEAVKRYKKSLEDDN